MYVRSADHDDVLGYGGDPSAGDIDAADGAVPILGVLDTDRTCMMYMRETMLMFIGGIIIALAVEYCNLHKRVALKVISLIGCSQRRLNFGLITVTMFVSMWISNTAAVAMMCPIMQAVLEELESVSVTVVYDKTVLLFPAPSVTSYLGTKSYNRLLIN
nr:protein I'm not dead yet-like [Aedes albopictus]XP_029714130.1 protein I'm not dead yet-like [Aedes albopictus]XP_029714131.1 protein I'm not dead yet-like [Aedes albopictus]